MLNIPGLIDLSPIFAILTTLAGAGYSTSGALTWLKNVALDGWTARMPKAQRNAILQGVLFAMNYALIFVLALFARYPLTWNLAGAVLIGAMVATGGAHGLYHYNQKPKASDPAGATPAPGDPTTAF